MKIGTFAKTNKLSIDSIRHYMKLGLVLPEKQGGHYHFDERCQNDLNDILSLKNMGFTLNEIKIIFKFKRLGKLTPYQEDEYYKTIFINKQKNLTEEIEELCGFKENLDDKLKELLNKKQVENYIMGVSLKVLDILCCPKCAGDLMLNHGSITNNQIIDGKLRCDCGEEYIIESGVLSTEKEVIHNDFDFEDMYTKYISDYINTNNSVFLDNINEGLEWIYKRINFDNFKNKVLLELGSGVGFFLRYIYNDLPEDCLYIAVDYNNQRHKFLKSILEKAGCKKNIVFICTDFLEIPIKHKSIDVLLDHVGTTNYSFKHSEFLLKLIDYYVKDEANLFGSYTIFKNFCENSLIEVNYRKNFILQNVKQSISQLKYRLIDDHVSDYIEKGSKFENYFIQGEKIFAYFYHGER